MALIDKVESLKEQAYEYLDAYDTKKAVKIGKKLKRLRHSSAYEILALAHQMDGNTGKAIKVLEKGTKLAPGVWLLWQLLGNLFSDEKRFAEAQSCYGSALSCEGVNLSSVHYNSALALTRAAKFKLALGKLDEVTDPRFRLKAAALRIDSLLEAREFGKDYASIDMDFEDTEEINDMSSLNASLAKAYWRLGENRPARAYTLESIRLDKHQEEARWLLREIDGKKSQESKHFHIIIEGEWHSPLDGDSECPGFYTSYDVIAENQRQAFEYLRVFEPEEIRSSLKIDEAKAIEDRPGEPQGVYSTCGYAFYCEEAPTNG